MVDLVLTSLLIATALFLVVLNGFFVAAEFAFVRIQETSVQKLGEQGRFGSKALNDATDELDKYLAVTQLGITVASLGLGWVGEPAVASLAEGVLGLALPESALHLASFIVAFGLVTFFHIVFGELVPKTLSIQRTEQISLLVATPMKFFRYLFIPGIIVFNRSANEFTKLFGISPAGETENTYSEDEIRIVLQNSTKEGSVDQSEYKMIERVFELDDVSVEEIMIPQPDVIALHPSDNLTDVEQLVVESGRTRYPVLEDGRGSVVGYIDIKDTFGIKDKENTTVRSLTSDIPVVPESATIDIVLQRIRSEQTQMVAVVDEWGAFSGIITSEDVVEFVVGELMDKYDSVEEQMSISQTDNGYTADGQVSLTRLNDVIGCEIDGKDVDTLSGIILSNLGEIPNEGDSIECNGHTMTVTDMDDERIRRVRVEKRS